MRILYYILFAVVLAGVFTCTVQKRDPIPDGKVTFYSKYTQEPIQISLYNYSVSYFNYTLTSTSTIKPNCGDKSGLSFSLPQGNYNWSGTGLITNRVYGGNYSYNSGGSFAKGTGCLIRNLDSLVGNRDYASLNSAIPTTTVLSTSTVVGSNRGTLTFWVSDSTSLNNDKAFEGNGCGCVGSIINVYINGYNNNISFSSSTKPACLSVWCANFSVPSGTSYTYIAYNLNTNYSWKGTTSIVSNGGCQVIQLK